MNIDSYEKPALLNPVKTLATRSVYSLSSLYIQPTLYFNVSQRMADCNGGYVRL